MARATETIEETATKHAPFDVMVASFADRKAAKEAYDALKSLEKSGGVKLEGAVVLDRDEMGRVRVQHATLPGWVWAVIGVSGVAVAGMAGLAVWGIARGVMSMTHRGEE